MKLLSLSLVLLLSGSVLSAENRCQELAISDCSPDKASIIFEINTSEALCQQYCTITPNCTFYRYDSKSTQAISCALYDESFSVYARRCNEITGPKGFNLTLLEECQNAGKTGNTNPCDIIQEGNCAFWGEIEGTDTLENAETCALLCEFVTCDYWVYQREAKQCLLQSDPKVGENRHCNMVYGPPHAENCDTPPEPSTQTPDPIFKTTTIAPPPGICDKFLNDSTLNTIQDENHCGCYWECLNGMANYQCCTNCFLYDIETGWCTNKEDPNFGGCGDRPYDADCNPKPGPPPCLYPDGYFRDNRTCDRYFICHYNISHTMQCEVKEDDWNGKQQLLYKGPFTNYIIQFWSNLDSPLPPVIF